MSLYKNKDQSEINGILQIFPESYKNNYGEDLNYDHLLIYLNDLLKKKEKEILDSSLATLSPMSIRLMIESIMQKTHNNESIMHNANGNKESRELFKKSSKKKDP